MVVEQCRKLINTHQFNNEAIRILVASLASGWRPTEAFILSTLQKFLLRELRLNEAAVENPDALHYIPHSKRYVVKTQKAVDGDDGADEEDDVVPGDGADASLSSKPNLAAAITIPTKHNPVALAVYGQISIDVRSYQTAICMSSHQIHLNIILIWDSRLSSPGIRLCATGSNDMLEPVYCIHRAFHATSGRQPSSSSRARPSVPITLSILKKAQPW